MLKLTKMDTMSDIETNTQTPYQVLARKYRPATFKDLIGQDTMVRTLKNAFESDRIAHAFILTGVRGVGKTTTARIIAKGMNCIGQDGNGKPTTSPCDQCEPCKAIAQGKHVDVMEMDAASRTGVGDIREIIDSVHYSAASARYKIYIIDEVHMLSTNAFNALLKTLEEPPEHVKFIFATTEIRKIPVTVLSRCQRFDLRRIEPEVMIKHLQKIAQAETVEISPDALALITRSSEGSVRDALSLLDQAIAHGAGTTTADQVRAMLGLADRGRVLDLFDFIMQGNAAAALTELSEQYAEGADPMAILRDMAEITHWISVIKISPEAADDPTVSPDERDRGKAAANDLPMRSLTRMWQMLLKSLEEISNAPNAMMAAEMAIIRLTHVADLPSPDELIRKLQNGPQPTPVTSNNAPLSKTQETPNTSTQEQHNISEQKMVNIGSSLAIAQPLHALAEYAEFDHVIKLIRKYRDMRLLVDVETCLRLVKYSPGRIEFQPTSDAPSDLAQRLGARLQTWTGKRWGVSLVNDGGGATIHETNLEKQNNLHAKAKEHPLVKATLLAFKGAKILSVNLDKANTTDEYLAPILETEEDWDPFDN